MSAPTEAGPAESDDDDGKGGDDGRWRPWGKRASRATSASRAKRPKSATGPGTKYSHVRTLIDLHWQEIEPGVDVQNPKEWSRKFYTSAFPSQEERLKAPGEIGVYALESNVEGVTVVDKLRSFVQAVNNSDLTNIKAVAAPSRAVNTFTGSDRQLLEEGGWVQIDLVNVVIGGDDERGLRRDLEQSEALRLANQHELVFLVHDWEGEQRRKLARAFGERTAMVTGFPENLDRLVADFEVASPGPQVGLLPVKVEGLPILANTVSGPWENRFGDAALASDVFMVTQEGLEMRPSGKMRTTMDTYATKIEVFDLGVESRKAEDEQERPPLRTGEGGASRELVKDGDTGVYSEVVAFTESFETSTSSYVDQNHEYLKISRRCFVVLPGFRDRGLCARASTFVKLIKRKGRRYLTQGFHVEVVIMEIRADGRVEDVRSIVFDAPKDYTSVDSIELTVVRGASDREFSIVITCAASKSFTDELDRKKSLFFACLTHVTVTVGDDGGVDPITPPRRWTTTEAFITESVVGGTGISRGATPATTGRAAVMPVVRGNKTDGLCVCITATDSRPREGLMARRFRRVAARYIAIDRDEEKGTVTRLRSPVEDKSDFERKVSRALRGAKDKAEAKAESPLLFDLEGVVIGDVLAFSFLHYNALLGREFSFGAVAAMAYVGERDGHNELVPIEFEDSHQNLEVYGGRQLSHAGARVGIIAVDAAFAQERGIESWGPAFGFVQTRVDLTTLPPDMYVRLVLARAPPDAKFKDSLRRVPDSPQ